MFDAALNDRVKFFFRQSLVGAGKSRGAVPISLGVKEIPCIVFVVYDPDGGFVTGGGWISSPPGSVPADPLALGRTQFGFNAKYRPGQSTPGGETRLQRARARADADADWNAAALGVGGRPRARETRRIAGARFAPPQSSSLHLGAGTKPPPPLLPPLQPATTSADTTIPVRMPASLPMPP